MDIKVLKLLFPGPFGKIPFMVEKKREAVDLSHQFIPEVPQQIIESAAEDLNRDRHAFIEHAIEELRSTGNNFLAERLISFRNISSYVPVGFGEKYALFAAFTAHCIIQAFQAKGIEVPKVTPGAFESVNGNTSGREKSFRPPTEREISRMQEASEEISLSNGPMWNAIEGLRTKQDPKRSRWFEITSGMTEIHTSFRRQANTDALDKIWNVDTK